MRAHPPRRSACSYRLRTLPACLLGLLLGLPSVGVAQGEPADEAVLLPSGVAVAVLERQTTSVPFSLGASGPLFALAPLARLFGAQLQVGPLGDSHTLHLADKEVVVGPGSPTMIVETADGASPEIVPLRQTPIQSADGLKVPLDFLDRAFGEELGYDFRWDPRDLRLSIERRQERELTASVNLVHQHRVTTLELQLSDVPRYRIERSPGVVDIHLIGDRFVLPLRRTPEEDPLIRRLAVSPDRLRIELVDGAAAGEPRFLTTPVPRLILEVFREAPPTEEGEEKAAREPSTTPPEGVRVIVLDPGHGGAETGAIGASGVAEKDLTLLLTRTLARRLERRLPVRVVLTRDGDEELPLDARTALANQTRADLFISLHVNSSFGSRAHGAETYFLSREASDQLAAAAAEEENRSAADEEDAESELQLILWDLAQTHHLAESQRFGTLVQEELNQALALTDRGVKQAPFRVLMGATMPAVLVELGFLSNPEEEARLQDPEYRDRLVESLVRAIVRFKNQVETPPVPADGEGPP